MRLSQIEIDLLVEQVSQQVIAESNYATLRHHLLERTPVANVTNAINSQLTQHYTADRDAMLARLKQEACERQVASDKQEATRDEQEKRSDELQKSQNALRLATLTSDLLGLTPQIWRQEGVRAQIDGNLSELRRDLMRVRRELDAVRHPIPVPVILPSVPVMTRSPVHGHHHTHSHLHLTPRVVVQRPVFVDAIAEGRLMREQTRLQSSIYAQEEELRRVNLHLSRLQSEKSNAEQEVRNKTTEINITLPTRERQRADRAQARQNREAARGSLDPNLLQLSKQNRETLQREEERETQHLKKRLQNLIAKAANLSYSTYLEQLETALTRPQSLKIISSENGALKSILGMMKEYSQMKKTEQSMEQALIQGRDNLKGVQRQLSTERDAVARNNAAIPRLEKENTKMQEENTRLNLRSETLRGRKTKALYTSLFGTASGLLSAGLIAVLVVNPLLIAVPASFALLTLVSLTVALVAHIQKSTSDRQSLTNQATISTNEASILNQQQRSKQATSFTIPELEEKERQSQQAIDKQASELSNHKKAIEQLEQKARNVTADSYDNGMGTPDDAHAPPSYIPGGHNGSRFFPSAPPAEPAAAAAPSAPPAYDEVQYDYEGESVSL